MNVQFYATREDFITVLRFAWDTFNGQFFEDYSTFDQEIRRFEAFDELAAYLCDQDERSASAMFCLEEGVHLLERERIALGPETGGKFRYTLRGWGLFQFQFQNIDQPYPWPADPKKRSGYCQWPFNDSRVAVNSYKRAKLWEDTGKDSIGVDAWPWAGIERTGRQIERYLRKSFLGQAPHGGGMLPGAAAVIAAGPRWQGKPQ